MATLPRFTSELSMRTPAILPGPEAGVPRFSSVTEPLTEMAQRWEEARVRLRKADEAVTEAEIINALRGDASQAIQELQSSGDYSDWGKRFGKMMSQRMEEKLSPYAGNKELFASAKIRATNLIGTMAMQVEAEGFGLHNDQLSARTNAVAEENRRRIAATANPSEKAQLLQETLDLQAAQGRAVGKAPTRIAAEQTAFKKEVAYDAVKQAGIEDPQATADILKDEKDTRYSAIPMDDRITLSQQMQSEANRRAGLSEAYQQTVEAAAHKELEILTKSLDERDEGERGELAAAVLRGQDILPILKDPSFARRQGDKVQSLAHFAKWARDEGQDDDPFRKNQLWKELSKDNPTITADQIMAWSGVSGKTKDTALFHLQSVRARLRTEGQTFYNAEYAMARENLVHNFSRSIVTSPSRGAQLAQMEASALQEFMVRTNKKEKPESPMAVSQDILTRHGPIFQEFNKVESDQVETALPPRYRGDDGMANLREDWTSGKVNGALASTYLTQMKKLKRLREAPETGLNTKPATPQPKPRM